MLFCAGGARWRSARTSSRASRRCSAGRTCVRSVARARPPCVRRSRSAACCWSPATDCAAHARRADPRVPRRRAAWLWSLSAAALLRRARRGMAVAAGSFGVLLTDRPGAHVAASVVSVVSCWCWRSAGGGCAGRDCALDFALAWVTLTLLPRLQPRALRQHAAGAALPPPAGGWSATALALGSARCADMGSGAATRARSDRRRRRAVLWLPETVRAVAAWAGEESLYTRDPRQPPGRGRGAQQPRLFLSRRAASCRRAPAPAAGARARAGCRGCAGQPVRAGDAERSAGRGAGAPGCAAGARRAAGVRDSARGGPRKAQQRCRGGGGVRARVRGRRAAGTARAALYRRVSAHGRPGAARARARGRGAARAHARGVPRARRASNRRAVCCRKR